MSAAVSFLFQYKQYNSLKTWQHKTKMLLLSAERMCKPDKHDLENPLGFGIASPLFSSY